MIFLKSTLICVAQSVPAEVYKSTFIMCSNFINLNMCMKEGASADAVPKAIGNLMKRNQHPDAVSMAFCFVFNLWSDLGLR